jgi:L-malate glycosyltransferase
MVSNGTAGNIAVCHVSSGDRWAGAEVQCNALFSALQRDPRLRVSAIFLNDGRPAEEARRCGIEVCTFDESRQNFFQILSGARRFLEHKEIQVLHSHRYKENLLAALLARRRHIPVHVVSKHGAPEPFTGWRGFKQGVLQAVDRWVMRNQTDCVISVSDELRTQLVRYLPEDKVVTIHNGIDEDRVFSRLSTAEAKQYLGLPGECMVIGTAGRLDPVKRLDIFLDAVKQIDSIRPDMRFVIAGEGTEERELRSLAHRLGLQDRLLFLGHRDDVYDVLRALDIFVLCSDHEGLPMALLEALYLGVPVVARPVGGVAEVIRNGTNGLCVMSAAPSDLAGVCLDLLSDPSRRSRLAEAGVATVAKEFTSVGAANKTLLLYRSFLSRTA